MVRDELPSSVSPEQLAELSDESVISKILEKLDDGSSFQVCSPLNHVHPLSAAANLLHTGCTLCPACYEHSSA